MTEIIVALIAGGLSLVGVIITSNSNSKRITTQIEHQLQISQAVTDTKLDELTREVRAHNNFAMRVPVLEEQMKVANHRIEDLEGYHKQPI
jgi:TolA-binding protein